MGRKKIAGLFLRGGVWHVDKQVRGYGRIRESTGACEIEEAERYLIKRLEDIRQQMVYGVRETHIWREAATRYLDEFADQPSIGLTATYLKQLDAHIGDMDIRHIDDEALQPYVQERLNLGRTSRTVNIALQRVIRILNLCARKWRDDQKRPWLDTVPMIELLSGKTARKPYPLSWDEQAILFNELPGHLKRMALYKVNTGCREQEVCKLRWDYEIAVPDLKTTVFLLPADFGGRHENSGVKNGEERLVVLNEVAKSIIEGQRGLDKTWVFRYGQPDEHGNATPGHRMNDTAWKNARVRSAKRWQETWGAPAHPGFASIRIHDLKHTFGRRLRAADVPEEDRRPLLGHTNGSITSHYSAAELAKLIEHANKVAKTDSRSPALTVLKRRAA